MNKHYIFSVIIPVYNTEAYVVETIESVLNQTIGFEENIQLILVNNATEDHSDVICRYYKQKFPNNIVYIELKENHGPNGARKEGLKYASGKYVNFLDSDDKWDKRAFEEAYRFLKKFGHIIPFVACRMKRFGDKNEWGFLDFKFNRTGIVDCLETPQSIQLSLCSCFFNREVFDRNQLDERISHSEDAVFIAQVLLKHDMRYGVASKAFFYYRYHSNRSSAMGYRNKTLSWYFNTPQYGYLSLINMSREKYGYVLPYIQYYLCIELTGVGVQLK